MAFTMMKLKELDERYARFRLVQPERVEAVKRSVERHGVLHPLVANADNEARVLLDGFKRLRALRELGVSEAPIRLVQLDEAAAKAALLSYNVPHRGVTEIEEAWVVQSLVRGCHLRQTDVAELLGRHKSWVCRRLLLADKLAKPLQDDMRLGLLGATVARELARLPRGNQARVAQVVQEHGLTTRQAADLVGRSLAASDEQARNALLDDPLRFLTATPSTSSLTKDPRLTPQGETVRRALVRYEGGAVGLNHTLDRYTPVSLADADLEVLVETAKTVGVLGRAAAERIAELLRAGGA